MTDNELKKLGRRELLEMLIDQSKEVQRLKEKLDEAEEKLKERKIIIDNAGSIAEASLHLNGVFEAAQAACQQYVDNISQLNERQEKMCLQMESESREKAENIIAEAEKKCADMELDTKQRCDEMVKKAQEESQAYWDEVSCKLEVFSEKYTELCQLLQLPKMGRNE